MEVFLGCGALGAVWVATVVTCMMESSTQVGIVENYIV